MCLGLYLVWGVVFLWYNLLFSYGDEFSVYEMSGERCIDDLWSDRLFGIEKMFIEECRGERRFYGRGEIRVRF